MAEIGKIPSLDALPVQGVISDLQTVIQARQRLKASFIMVCTIQAAPSGLPAELKNRMGTIRFHITTALSAIDDFLYMGKSTTAKAGEVPNLMLSIQSHVEAIRAARPAWDAWLKTESPPEAPAPLPKVSSIDPAAAWAGATVKPASALESMSSPTPLRTYLAIGGVALGALLLMKLVD